MSVRDWLDEQASETLYLSSVTIAELLFGIGVLPEGRRKDKLARSYRGSSSCSQAAFSRSILMPPDIMPTWP